MGTVLAAVQAKENARIEGESRVADAATPAGEVSSTNSLQDKSVAQLTQEVDELRDTVQQDRTVEVVLVNPWFGGLGTIGTTITAASFYVEWICKRRKPLSQIPSPERDLSMSAHEGRE